MSLLPNVSYINPNNPVFLLANVSSINVNSISTNQINANNIYTQFISSANGEINELTTSTISTTQLDLDGQTLNATPTELLLNGIPLATTSNISSLEFWAIDPAISSINANNNDLLNTNLGYFQTVSTTNIRANNILANNILANNIFAMSTYTSTISSLAEVADFAFIDHLSAGNAYIDSLSTSKAWIDNISANSVEIQQLNLSTIVANSANFSSLTVSSIDGTQFSQSSITTSSITVNVMGVSSLVADTISSVGAELRQAFMSSIVFSPSLNPSLGGVNVNLGLGGLLGNVVGWGAGVFGAAAGVVGLVTGATALYQGRQSQNITTNNYELVNGTTQLQISTLGESFSTIYRFNNSIDPASVPGEEIFISTIYPPGLAIRTLSDPLYTLSTPQSTIQAQGQWVSLGDTLDVADWAYYPALSTIQGDNNDMVQVRNADISTISTAIIYGANTDLFGVFGVAGLKIDAANVFLSTPQVVHPGFFNGSTIGANLVQAPIISTNLVNCSTGAILANGVSCQQVNTQQLTLNQNILSTATVAGSASQPAGRLVLGGNDFDLGQNDLWCQQVRIGAGNTGTQAEIVLYQPDGGTKSLNTNSADRTLRMTTSATGGGSFPGYLLDTFVNAPFFSTINQSTAMMSYFPSTTSSTIGVSTLSFIPPLTVAGSWYSSTSQTVAGANTETALTYNSQSVNVGGFTYSGSTITVPVAGLYEITHSIQFATSSGGTNLAQFYPLKNGTSIPQTNSIVSIVNNGDTLGTISIFDTAAANDKYGIAIYSADNNMTASATAAGATPAIPSVITNIKRIT